MIGLILNFFGVFQCSHNVEIFERGRKKMCCRSREWWNLCIKSSHSVITMFHSFTFSRGISMNSIDYPQWYLIKLIGTVNQVHSSKRKADVHCWWLYRFACSYDRSPYALNNLTYFLQNVNFNINTIAVSQHLPIDNKFLMTIDILFHWNCQPCKDLFAYHKN